ncbi:MAG: hypothetical protein U5K76_01295 [Woeseiaceae bacterium]|nr:hypothetical protein [Woeseiaceae bacterium]
MKRPTGNKATAMQSLQVLLDRMDALTVRERVLIAITALAVLGSAWHLLLMQPLLQAADAASAEIAATRARIEVANSSLEDQVLQLARSDSDSQTRYALIRQRLEQVDAELAAYSGQLIDPAEMAFVLERVLKSQSGLRLKRIRNLGAEALTTDAEDDSVILYRHGLEIEVEGSYMDCLAYLQEIEALPWRFYWQFFELDVLDYPNNRVRIEVSTLSLDEEWIGA